MRYAPRFTLTNKILSLVASISEQLGRLSATVNSNQLSEDQITAILEGK